MPQTLAEMIRDSEDRVLADIPSSRYVEKLTLEKLREVKALVERPLEKMEKKKPASPRATKGRRRSGTSSR